MPLNIPTVLASGTRLRERIASGERWSDEMVFDNFSRRKSQRHLESHCGSHCSLPDFLRFRDSSRRSPQDPNSKFSEVQSPFVPAIYRCTKKIPARPSHKGNPSPSLRSFSQGFRSKPRLYQRVYTLLWLQLAPCCSAPRVGTFCHPPLDKRTCSFRAMYAELTTEVGWFFSAFSSKLMSASDASSKVIISKSKPSAFPSALRAKRSAVQTLTREDVQQDAVIERTCPRCDRKEMRWYTQQLRSADEGTTVFYHCVCGYKESVNN